MSTSKLDRSGIFRSPQLAAESTQLCLPAEAIRFRQSGIEFRTGKPIPPWTEVTVGVQTIGQPKLTRFHGVVVDCTGTKHAGFVVSLLFTGLSKQSKAKLEQLAFARQSFESNRAR